MHWIHNFQLFLFDFDGLLVNTEELHYLAYKRVFSDRGLNLSWDFNYYCRLAHYSSDGLRKQIYIQYPELEAMEPNWQVLYEEKKRAIIRILNEQPVLLMPGAQQLLEALQEANIPRCVVTHSPLPLIETVKAQNPVLHSIPYWITREHYQQPKPHPECYQKAIAKLAKPSDKIIGFEDTPRGLTALMGTQAKPVLVCNVDYPEISEFTSQGASHFPTLDSIPHSW